jgi:hypothetical protein
MARQNILSSVTRKVFSAAVSLLFLKPDNYSLGLPLKLVKTIFVGFDELVHRKETNWGCGGHADVVSGVASEGHAVAPRSSSEQTKISGVRQQRYKDAASTPCTNNEALLSLVIHCCKAIRAMKL